MKKKILASCGLISGLLLASVSGYSLYTNVKKRKLYLVTETNNGISEFKGISKKKLTNQSFPTMKLDDTYYLITIVMKQFGIKIICENYKVTVEKNSDNQQNSVIYTFNWNKDIVLNVYNLITQALKDETVDAIARNSDYSFNLVKSMEDRMKIKAAFLQSIKDQDEQDDEYYEDDEEEYHSGDENDERNQF